MPTKQVKNETTTHPQTRLAGPAYRRLEPYSGVIPVKSVIVENDIARVLNRVCTPNKIIQQSITHSRTTNIIQMFVHVSCVYIKTENFKNFLTAIKVLSFKTPR